MKPSDFLVLVRNEVDNHGWCQHAFHDKTGALSLDGAIQQAMKPIQLHKISRRRKLSPGIWAEYLESSQSATTAVETLQDMAQKIGAGTIVVFNDITAQSKTDVLKFLDRGIRLLRQRE